MKILLDENLPRKLKADFGAGHEVKAVRDMGWQGKRNGELLGLIMANGFNVFITVDKNLKHQQNLDKYTFYIFLLLSRNNRRETLQPLAQKIGKILIEGNFGKLTEIS